MRQVGQLARRSWAALVADPALTQRGMEFAIFMMLIAIAIFIRGGGNFSLDNKLPKEL